MGLLLLSFWSLQKTTRGYEFVCVRVCFCSSGVSCTGLCFCQHWPDLIIPEQGSIHVPPTSAFIQLPRFVNSALFLWGKLTIFYADLGKEFPLSEISGEVHPGAALLQALCCALCSTEQSTFRGGEKDKKVPRKGEEEGWPAKGAKRKKGRVKTGQENTEKSTTNRGPTWLGGPS